MVKIRNKDLFSAVVFVKAAAASPAVVRCPLLCLFACQWPSAAPSFKNDAVLEYMHINDAIIFSPSTFMSCAETTSMCVAIMLQVGMSSYDAFL